MPITLQCGGDGQALVTSRNSCVGGMKPELPTTGSRMTPAISSLLASNAWRTLSRSL